MPPRPISARSTTDLDAEYDRSRAGSGPISARSTTDLGGGGGPPTRPEPQAPRPRAQYCAPASRPSDRRRPREQQPRARRAHSCLDETSDETSEPPVPPHRRHDPSRASLSGHGPHVVSGKRARARPRRARRHSQPTSRASRASPSCPTAPASSASPAFQTSQTAPRFPTAAPPRSQPGRPHQRMAARAVWPPPLPLHGNGVCASFQSPRPP